MSGSAFQHAIPNSPNFYYANQALPKTNPLPIYQGKRRGQVYFDDDVVHPNLFEQEAGTNKSTTWMGLAPMEILTQRKGVLLASGRVVVGGLGLGWFLNAVCRKPSVTEVVVVDREPKLLKWLRKPIEAAYPAVAEKCKSWIASDVYEYMEKDVPANPGSKYLLDIWPSYGEYDSKFEGWKTRLTPATLWGWGMGEVH